MDEHTVHLHAQVVRLHVVVIGTPPVWGEDGRCVCEGCELSGHLAIRQVW